VAPLSLGFRRAIDGQAKAQQYPVEGNAPFRQARPGFDIRRRPRRNPEQEPGLVMIIKRAAAILVLITATGLSSTGIATALTSTHIAAIGIAVPATATVTGTSDGTTTGTGTVSADPDDTHWG
jgi:hypothetical protein